jgi:hypothetical protein
VSDPEDEIPGLPRQNSTESIPDSEVVAFLRSIGLWPKGPPMVERAKSLDELVRLAGGNPAPNQHAREAEAKTVSEGSWLPKTLKEAVPHLVWGVLILAFGFVLVESVGELFPNPVWRAVYGFVGMVGLTIMLIFRWWLLDRFKTLSGGSILAAFLVLLVVVVLSPYVEQRVWPFIAPSRSDTTTSAFSNPLREDTVKWKIAESIRSATIAGQLSAHCHVTIVRLQEPYAEDYASDFRRILDVINWKFDERFAARPVDKGLTVRGVADEIQSNACARTLAGGIQNDAHTRNGGTFDPLRWTSSSDAPDYLKQCPEGCIEVDFGNNDSQ